MYKKIGLVIVFVVCLLGLCGCDKDNKEFEISNESNKVSIVEEDFDMSGAGELYCTTEAYAGDDVSVDLNYRLTYKRGNILKLRSIAKITSDNQDSLDQYETAYQKIAANYEELKYYDVSLIRDSNTVVYDTTINYSEIDIKKLLDIEGEEDNIIEDGKAKLSLWLDLAERVGTTCEEV